MKKIFAVTVALLLALLPLGGCGKEAPQALTAVRLCEVTHSVFYAPFYAALELG